jgi:hypothetical protein
MWQALLDIGVLTLDLLEIACALVTEQIGHWNPWCWLLCPCGYSFMLRFVD